MLSRFDTIRSVTDGQTDRRTDGGIINKPIAHQLCYVDVR